MSIRTLVSCFFSVALATLACCNGSGGGCPGSSSSMMPPTEQACTSCVLANCSSQFSAAFGPNWTSGNFSGGACSSYLECAQNCGCNESCLAGCFESGFMGSCEQAETAVGQCEAAHCLSACVGDMGTR